jgi:hypothetical protein
MKRKHVGRLSEVTWWSMHGSAQTIAETQSLALDDSTLFPKNAGEEVQGRRRGPDREGRRARGRRVARGTRPLLPAAGWARRARTRPCPRLGPRRA